jgi:hypothetical protein
MTKLKPEGWDQLSRSSKLAACLWPQLVPDNIRREMQAISYGEGKTDPLTAKVRADNARSGVRVNYRTGRR